jgi:PAS domain S-box-containing protein
VHFFILIEGIGLLCALAIVASLVLRASRLHKDMVFTLCLLASVHLLAHASNLAEWGYQWSHLDAIEDYMQVLEPLLWCFALYSFLYHSTTDRIQSSERRLRDVLEGTRDVIYRRDLRTGSYEFLSSSCLDVFGYTREEFQAMRLSALLRRVHPQDRDRVREALMVDMPAQEEAGGTVEFRWKKKCGNYVWLSNRFARARATESGEDYIVGTVRDISRLKEAQRRLEKAVADLLKSNEELERFAHVASHDLQEPLRSVAAYLQLLERKHGEELSDEALEFVHAATDSACRMNELIQDLLVYSRLGGQSPERHSVDCASLLEHVQQDLSEFLENKGAVITHGRLPTVQGDPAQLQQLLQNLVANGAKFSRDGLPARVHVEACQDDGCWVFSVMDNGIGFEPEFSEVIFQAYKRLHSHENYPGTGMGLAICKRIVESHGGRIWAESQLGQGTTIQFTLPRSE